MQYLKFDYDSTSNWLQVQDLGAVCKGGMGFEPGITGFLKGCIQSLGRTKLLILHPDLGLALLGISLVLFTD